MIRSRTIKDLKNIEDAVLECAKSYNRKIPEIRFFVLNSDEFMSLLEKKVYPFSPANIWEGKNVIKRRYMSDIGRETGIYYEVVQCGNPSYAYLNENNSLTTQASVMAHVIGHCEFSEINVLKDSDPFRTEYAMFLTKKIETSIKNMGVDKYTSFWNACESVIPLVSPNSQYSLKNSVETDSPDLFHDNISSKTENDKLYKSYSSTLDTILSPIDSKKIYKEDLENKNKREEISRHGYKLKCPCQDILGFLKEYAPASESEKYIMEYMYFVARHHDFIAKTQIMNEGWSMYWEKKIMADLFKQNVVKDVIDYCRIFSGVCYPRPFFMRNPYHMGYHMWKHIEESYKKGKISLAYNEETDREIKNNWNKGSDVEPIKQMDHLVGTITDYEFIRRFLTHDLIDELYLNRITIEWALKLGLITSSQPEDLIIRADNKYIYLSQDFVKKQMLDFFSDYYAPMIYIVDTEFNDGGLLLYHRHKGVNLRYDWIPPTLSNINKIWKSPVYLMTGSKFYRVSGKEMGVADIKNVPFEEIRNRMLSGQKPFEYQKDQK